MTTSQKIVSAVLGLWLVALTGFLFLGNTAASPTLGTVSNSINHLLQGNSWFTGIAYFGTSQQASIDASGNVTTSGSVTSASASVTGALVVGTFTQGGGVLATTSIGAGTLTAANIATNNVIQQTNTGAITLTLPASSTLTSFIPTAGQVRSLFIANLGTAAVTLAGGTGTSIKVASSTSLIGATGLKVIQIGGTGRLDFFRKSNTDIEVILTPAL
jgi:hypothetical protein